MVLPNLFQIFTACTFFLYFWMGCIVRKYFHTLSNKQLLTYGLIAMAVNFISYGINEFVCIGSTFVVKVMSMGFDELSKVSGAIMAFFMLNFIARHVQWGSNSFFKYLSSVSFPIYLFHQQVICVVLWNLNGMLNPYLLAGLNFVVSILLSMITTEIMMKHKYTRCLIGAK